MSASRLLLDEMLSATIAAQLRARDLDVVAVVENPALISSADESLLTHAVAEQRALVTANIADFAAIARDWASSGRTHHGIVHVAHRRFPPDRSFVGALVASLAALCADDGAPLTGLETFLPRAG